MSTRQKVLDQLDKSIAAHRVVHHHSVRAARRERARLAAEAAGLTQPPADETAPEPIGMAAGMPVQDLTGIYDLGD